MHARESRNLLTRGRNLVMDSLLRRAMFRNAENAFCASVSPPSHLLRNKKWLFAGSIRDPKIFRVTFSRIRHSARSENFSFPDSKHLLHFLCPGRAMIERVGSDEREQPLSRDIKMERRVATSVSRSSASDQTYNLGYPFVELNPTISADFDRERGRG